MSALWYILKHVVDYFESQIGNFRVFFNTWYVSVLVKGGNNDQGPKIWLPMKLKPCLKNITNALREEWSRWAKKYPKPDDTNYDVVIAVSNLYKMFYNTHRFRHISFFCGIGSKFLNLKKGHATNVHSKQLSYYKSSSVCLFVCLSVCSLSPPRSFDRSSPNLVGVCRWTSELPLRGSFSKRSTARRVNGSLSLSTILYMHQPHATRCNGSSCLQLQSLIRHLLLDGYRTASQQCI